MGIASERNDSGAYWPGLVQAVRGVVVRLYGFFAVSDDEWSKVGIYLGGMEQGR